MGRTYVAVVPERFAVLLAVLLFCAFPAGPLTECVQITEIARQRVQPLAFSLHLNFESLISVAFHIRFCGYPNLLTTAAVTR